MTYKVAHTLDGRVATRSGASRWITGARARKASHELRANHDAIAVGVGTVLADDPQLTCRVVVRGKAGHDPIRIVVDSQLRTPVDAAVVRVAAESSAESWIVCASGASDEREAALRAAGAKVERVPAGPDGRVAVPLMLARLAELGIETLLLEGGPTLAGAFLSARRIDRWISFIAPKVIGDAEATPMLFGPAVATLGGALELEDLTVVRVGSDLMLEARPRFVE
ncbi:MAG: RibD family protein [Myxococcales bacterium]|nr:RibD family protein [Myxococcales bacterium]